MSDYLEIVREVLREQQRTHPPEQGEPLESVLKGKAVELYLKDEDRFFIVDDEDDARRLGEPRGATYTATEARRLVQITDPATVAEVHRWKRQFKAIVRDCLNHR